MIYDFDKKIDRVGTNCFKYDKVKQKFGYEAFPMWIADMDFETPPFILDDLKDSGVIYDYNGREITTK